MSFARSHKIIPERKNADFYHKNTEIYYTGNATSR